MRLHAITLRHYRRHRDLRVELDPQRTLMMKSGERNSAVWP